MRAVNWMRLTLLPVTVAGCGQGGGGTALDRDAFYRPPAGTVTQRHVLEDRPESPQYNHVRLDLLEPNPGVRLLPQEQSAVPGESVTAIAPEVRESIQLPTDTSERLPATAPGVAATLPAPAESITRPGIPSGVAMLLGTVVCEVNGTPIFADKVLASLSRLLAVEARQRDQLGFRVFAEEEIKKQVRVYIFNELEFAMAEKNLDTSERQLAADYTARWRQQQITQAGGSLERTRAKFSADGWDFEERVREEFRNNMVLIYMTKKVLPQAQVRADDMRRYYFQNLHTTFTEADQAQFRVIKVDIARTGGEEPAKDKAAGIYERAKLGEDFTAMASSVNDEPAWMRSGGDVGGWIQRGAFRLEDLETAIWKLQPGEVTPPVRVDDAFYIAKLENRKIGRVRPFEEQAVQDEIANTLRRQQISLLHDRQRQMLMQNAVLHPDPPNIQPVVEMAMQKYPWWASAGQ